MRTVTFKSVFDQCGRVWLGDPGEVTYSLLQKQRMADAISHAVTVAYEHCDWKDFVQVEERPFRPVWNDTDTYAEGTEIYDSEADAYYIANVENTGKQPSENSTEWTEIEDFDYYIPWEMTGYWPIMACMGIYATDPSMADAYSFSFKQDSRGIWVQDCERTKVWLSYRMQAPQYTMTPFSESESDIELGDIRYFEELEDCYQALRDDQGYPVWVKVPLPYIFRLYAVYAASAELLADPELSGRQRSLAAAELDRIFGVYYLRNQDEPLLAGWSVE